MVYQALYRKWRPLSFEDVVGQKHITDTLKTELKTGRLAHAYMFCGTRGTGKTTTAKILSRAVNCENLLPNGNPCNCCDSCKGILNGSVMDVLEIDAASNNGVDDIRELRDEIAYTPANVKYKVYIIDEVHMLSSGAFNALLKTLEEPPAHAVFILATTEPHKIPATIQSRCQRFDFRRISAKDIAGRIGEITRKDGIAISQDAIRLVAELGDGSMRDALSVLDLCGGIEGEISRTDIENVTGAVSRDGLMRLASALLRADAEDALLQLAALADAGREIQHIIEALLEQFRGCMICTAAAHPEAVLEQSDETIAGMRQLAAGTSIEALIYAVRVFSETAGLCKTASNPRIILEAAIIRYCNPAVDPCNEAYALRLKKLEALAARGGLATAARQPASAPEQPTAAADVPFDLEPPAEEEYESGQEVPAKEGQVPPLPAEPPVEAPPKAEQPTAAADVPFDLEPPAEEEYESGQEELAEEDWVPPLPAEPPVEAPPAPQPEPVPAANSEPAAVQHPSYEAAVDAIAAANPPLGALLRTTAHRVRDGVDYILFDNDVIKESVEQNPAFTDTIKQALGCEHLKLVTADAFDGKQKQDPLDELAALAGDMEQITLF